MSETFAPRFLPAGETALVVEYGRSIDPLLHDHVLALDAALAVAKIQGQIEGIIETVPTYRSLMIHFDPRATDSDTLIRKLAALDVKPRASALASKRWRIPVCYDPSLAEDLGEVASTLHLPIERIVSLHAEALYRVYMYGFAPGFTFLGGLPDELSISRRATPRPPAPPGSLLIAGGQALITSIAMPTGWYVIGQTPVRVFDPARAQPFLTDVGDEILFERIDLATFKALQSDAAAGALVARQETA
jgi:KipI family sensor histidine kinase inhibitor